MLMSRGLVIHNTMQLTIPIWLVPMLFNSFPRIEFSILTFASVFGMLFPDIDHFSMWRKFRGRGFWGFIKFCISADRYRKAFLPFHNHVAIYIVGTVTILSYFFVNFYVFAFFLSFFVHLMFDYIADLYLIKQHTHWRLRNWFNENYSGLSTPQQIQQSDEQKHES